MGRFYQTSEGKFVDNNMYQMPYELATQVIGNAEERVDKQVAETALLTGAVDSIAHLNFEAENQRVAAIQDKYNTQIDELTNSIMKNPLEFQRNMPALKKVQRELMQSKTSGDIFSIEQRYGQYQKWAEDNKKSKEDSPDLYNQLQKHWYDDISTRATDNKDATFKGEQIINRPDLSSKEFREQFENIKANMSENITNNGMYKIGNKEVSKERVAQIAMAELLSSPGYEGYLKQMGDTLGQEGFLDAQGNPLPVFTEDGKLNFAHPFAKDIASTANIYGFSESTIDEAPYMADKLKADQNLVRDKKKAGYEAGRDRAKAGYASSLEAQKQKGRLAAIKAKGEADKDKLKFANALEKDIAIKEGDLETLDNILVTSKPYKVVTIEEQKELGKTHLNLATKVSAGKELTGPEQIQYNKTKGLYKGVIDAHGDKILKAAGEDPSTYKDPEVKAARVERLLSEVFQLNDPEFGIVKKHLPYDPKRTFAPTYNEDHRERHRVQGIRNKMEAALGNFDEMIADKMVITRSFMPVDSKTKMGKTGMGVVNTLVTSMPEPIIQNINGTGYDIDGKKRSGERVDVDTSYFGTGETSSPMQAIMEATGMSSPQQLVENEYGNFTWRMERGDYIVDFIPNNTALKGKGIDTTDRNWNSNGFSMRYSDVTGDVWGQFDMSNPDVRRARMESDVTYSEAAQNVDTNIAALKASNYQNSYPFTMGGASDVLYKIEYDQKQKNYIILQKYDKDTTTTWEEIKDQGIFDYASTPEELTLYLREEVINRNKTEE